MVVLLFTNLFWIAVVVVLLRNLKHFRRCLSAFMAQKSGDKDDVIALLEAAKVTGSPLADKLLKIAQADTEIGEHDPDAGLGLEQRWDLFLDDMDLEETDASRLNCLRNHIMGGERFSEEEIVAIIAMFEGVEMRDMVRGLLRPPVLSDLPVNIGRAQAVVEATCGCGARAAVYNVSIDNILTATCSDLNHKFFETGVKVYDGLIVKKGVDFSLLTRSGSEWTWTALKEKS